MTLAMQVAEIPQGICSLKVSMGIPGLWLNLEAFIVFLAFVSMSLDDTTAIICRNLRVDLKTRKNALTANIQEFTTCAGLSSS